MRFRSGCGVALATAVVATALVGSGTGVAETSGSVAETSGSAVGAAAVGAVFAPGTDADDIATTLAVLREGPLAQQFSNHWNPTSTALNNGGGADGDALELTWSIMPDGTSMPSQFAGDTACNSNLISTFNGIYGAGLWQAEIQKVWDDWTALAGNVYTPAVTPDANGTPIDDGAAWPSSLGVAGVRGDIRIGGCSIDGNFNILAYNYFPSNGDMKIDATDSFFASSSLATGFHNVFSHEHGHGAGLNHVCPRNATKLMEPTVNLNFTGLQHDDIRGVQRGYGDRFELINNPNDSSGAATPLTLAPTQTEAQLSLDSTGDTDWFTFTATAGDTVDVTVDPNGLAYNEGPDVGSDLCDNGADPGTPINSKALQDLSFEIRDATGVLTTVNATGAGTAESISSFALPTSGTYFVRVVGTGIDDTQLYDFTVTKTAGPAAPTWPDFNGDGLADRGVFRPEFGGWYVDGMTTEFLGLAGDVPVPGDYDGDGVTERAVFRNGAWYIEGQATRFLGVGTDRPVPGDYDGDGDWEPAVYRDGAWFIEGQATKFLGVATDVPVPADYDGDDVTEVAVFRPSVGGWYVEGAATVFYGLSSDVPVPADYDGDGSADRAVFRPEFGGWYVDGMATEFIGLSSDVPVPADYTGNGIAERAVFRPEFGGWYVQGAATVFYGLSSDIPLPLPAAVYNTYL